jgi:hypothetical protein
MWPLLIVLFQPPIKIHLKLLERRVEFLAKGHAVELILNRFVETFANAVGLWMLRFRSGVINILNSQVTV